MPGSVLLTAYVISQSSNKKAVWWVLFPRFYRSGNSETLTGMLKVTQVLKVHLWEGKVWAFSFTMLAPMGRDDREVRGQRRKGHWILIPGQ